MHTQPPMDWVLVHSVSNPCKVLQQYSHSTLESCEPLRVRGQRTPHQPRGSQDSPYITLRPKPLCGSTAENNGLETLDAGDSWNEIRTSLGSFKFLHNKYWFPVGSHCHGDAKAAKPKIENRTYYKVSYTQVCSWRLLEGSVEDVVVMCWLKG